LLDFFNNALTREVLPQPEGAAMINRLDILIQNFHSYFGIYP